MPKCEICGEFKILLTESHFQKHGISTQDYKKSFPGYPLMERSMAENHSKLMKEGHKNNKYDNSNIIKLGKRKRTEKERETLSDKLKNRWENPKTRMVLDQARRNATESITLPIGTKNKRTDGYIEIKTASGWILEHRLVMERKLNRPLLDDEVIHHIDFSKDNNSEDNLKIISLEDHNRLHQIRYWESKKM